MSARLVRWSSSPGGNSPDDFLERFQACGAKLRNAGSTGHGPSEAYTSTVLRVGLQRPAQLMLVEFGGEDVARAAAFRCASADRAGMIGLYEAAPGAQGDDATARLLDAALDWAGTESLGELFAPVDANTWFTYRFMLPHTDGTRAPPPFAWEPAHPPAYLDRFRAHGFEEAALFETVGFDFPVVGPYTVADLVVHTRKGWEEATSAGYAFERLDTGQDVLAFLDELHPVCMEAFADNPLFEPLPPELFRSLYGDVLATTEGHLTFYTRDREGRLAGFVFAFPDREAVVIKTIAVTSTARGKRLSSALLHRLFVTAAELRIDRFVSALVRAGATSEFLVDPHRMPTVDTWTRRYVLLRRDVER